MNLHYMLQELLSKHGVKKQDLNAIEQERFARWEAAFNRTRPSMGDLDKFLAREFEFALTELRKYRNDKEQDTFYKCYITIIMRIREYVKLPDPQDVERAENEVKEALNMPI